MGGCVECVPAGSDRDNLDPAFAHIRECVLTQYLADSAAALLLRDSKDFNLAVPTRHVDVPGHVSEQCVLVLGDGDGEGVSI